MMNHEKLVAVAKQFQRGILTEQELEWEILEILDEDRKEILAAEREGTLVEIGPDDL